MQPKPAGLELNCSSLSLTVDSLSTHFGIQSDELKSYLSSIDMEKLDHDDFIDCGIAQGIEQMVCQELGIVKSFAFVRWFHLTRALPDASFEAGLLPLGEFKDEFWQQIGGCIKRHATRADFLAFVRAKGSFRLQLKDDPAHWGPYAMLVRDVAFVPDDVSNFDYLRLPEIVADACDGFAAGGGARLHEEIAGKLVPTIVHFREKAPSSTADVVGAACMYTIAMLRAEAFPIYGNTCFNGHGRLVPFEDIIQIEKLI